MKNYPTSNTTLFKNSISMPYAGVEIEILVIPIWVYFWGNMDVLPAPNPHLECLQTRFWMDFLLV